MPSSGLSPEQIDHLFPFLLAVDRKRRVVRIGRSMQLLVPALAPGALISEYFSIQRPNVDWFDESLNGQTDSVFTVHIKGNIQLPLKGQLVVCDNGNLLQFMLRPAIWGTDALSKSGLSVRDFALHDPLVDSLFLLQAQETSMRELRSLAATIETERAALKGANLELGFLYGVSDILGRSQTLEEALSPLVDQFNLLLNGVTALLWAKAATGRDWIRSEWIADSMTNGIPSLYVPTSGSALASLSNSKSVAFAVPLSVTDDVERVLLQEGRKFVTCVSFSSGSSQYVLQLFSNESRVAFNIKQALRIVAGRLTGFLALIRQREQEESKTRAEVQILTHAAQSAAEKNRQKTQYLAQVNHDIRTPMNAILGMSELLLGTKLDAKQADYASIVRDSTRSLLGLINSSLDLARIEAGRLTLSSAPFDLHSLIENCAYLFAQQAQAKGVSLEWRISNDVPRGMRGDGERLRQVLSNLLGNAVKFTARGSIMLRVGLAELRDTTCRLSFIVEDTGSGIPEHELEQVLEPFTQSETGNAEGSGLGLAIVKAFAKLMDSDVEITSAVGEGTKVAICPQLHVDPAAGAWQPPESLREQSVVLVGDPAGMLHQQLCRLGCRPTLATEESLSPNEGDVVVVDLSSRSVTRGKLAASIVDATTITAGGEELSGISHVVGWPPRERALADQLTDERFESLPTSRIQKIGGRILIVDDSALNRRLVAEFLTLWGLEFEEATNGAVAVTMWETNSYDLIVMDCQMPIMDGLSATSEIRRREPAGQHIPILALTAHAMASDVAKCSAAGMDDYLSKPLEPGVLRRKITSLLFSRQSDIERNVSTSDSSATVLETIDEVVWSRLLDLQKRSGEDLLVELIGMYQTQSHELAEKIRKAIIDKEQVALLRWAHSLKGTAGSIGAAKVEQLCRNLETMEEPSLVICDELDEAVVEAHKALVSRLPG